MTNRAPVGQGLDGLKARAREAAAAHGHDLGQFRALRQRGAVLARGSVLSPLPARSWRARCARCNAVVVIIPDQVPVDGVGFGGSALRNACCGPRDDLRGR